MASRFSFIKPKSAPVSCIKRINTELLSEAVFIRSSETNAFDLSSNWRRACSLFVYGKNNITKT